MLNADVIREHRSLLARVVVFLCGCYFVLAVAGQAWKARELSLTLAQEQQTLVRMNDSNARLEERLAYLNGKGYDAYVERTAREKLGLVRTGDTAVFVVPDMNAPQAPTRPALKSAVAPPATAPREPLPVWRQWLEVYFP